MNFSISAPTALPTTEEVNPRTENLDRLSTSDLLTRINDEDQTVAGVVRAQIPQIARAVDEIAEKLRWGGRLIYIGAGTSGRLGVLDAAECLPTFRMAPEQVFGIIAGGEKAVTRAVEGAEDDQTAGESAVILVDVSASDAVVGISASGGAPFVRAAIRAAKERGAITISIANSENAPLSGDADIAIEAVTGPEVITGSTRMKAGTAQKLICNMLSTGAMVRIGKTFGNRMVDVQATNTKLVARATRLIAEIGQVSEKAAGELLTAAGGSVKTAIVMARHDLAREDAERRLADVDHFLAAALAL